MIQALIFDLDGVITDTAEYHFIAWEELADELDWVFDREVNEKLRGVSRMDSIKIIAEHNNQLLNEDQLVTYATKKNTLYVKSLEKITPNDYLPGIKNLLDTAKKEGYKIGLGSASKNAKAVLKYLNALHYFDAIGDGNSVTKSKPAPDVFLYTANKLEIDPSNCLVFEDAESGIDAANTGGFHSVGIGPKERIGHADIFFPDTNEVTLEAIKQAMPDLFN